MKRENIKYLSLQQRHYSFTCSILFLALTLVLSIIHN